MSDEERSDATTAIRRRRVFSKISSRRSKNTTFALLRLFKTAHCYNYSKEAHSRIRNARRRPLGSSHGADWAAQQLDGKQNHSSLRRTPSTAISDFRFCNWRWCNTLSLQRSCAVFRYGTGVPLYSACLPRISVRQAVRDKRVVGAHAGTCSGFWCGAGVCRIAGVARPQEIRST